MPYLLAKAREKAELITYRNYIADSLYWGNQSGHLTVKYSDLRQNIYKRQENDNRTGDEIAKDVIERLGLELR